MMATQAHTRPGERGFTLIELTVSIGASAIVMLTVMSLMGFTHREWIRGMDKAELMSETTLAVQQLTETLRSADQDSVSVSALGDTLKVGSQVRFYKDVSSGALIFQKGLNNSFEYLDDMVTGFTATTPVIQAPGDTLQDAVKVTLLMHNGDVQDSTSVIVYPRTP